jgi:Fe-S-cluster containining protein
VSSAPVPPSVTLNVDLDVGSRRFHAQVEVPTGNTPPRSLLPLAQAVTDAAVSGAIEDVTAYGLSIPCQAGCGACCRQLVPLTQAEAYHVRDLVDALPEPRRSAVRARFAEAKARLQAAGMLEAIWRPEQWALDPPWPLGFRYFELRIPCPFLEQESCSIHRERPLICREYVVVTPPECCASPRPGEVKCLHLDLDAWQAFALATSKPVLADEVPWVPLVLALEWAETHPEEAWTPGTELVQRFFEQLSGKTLTPPTLGDPPSE